MSLEDDYKTRCAIAQVKPNSLLVQMLRSATGDDMTTLDLTHAVVGTNGLVPVCALIGSRMPNLVSLILKGNNLSHTSTRALLDHLSSHTALTSIDLSCNDIRLSGPDLVELLKANRNITKLNVEETFLRPLFLRLIDIQLKKNAKGNTSSPSAKGGKGGEEDPESENPFSCGGAPFQDKNDPAESVETFCSDSSKHVHFQSAGGAKLTVRRATVCSEVYKEDEIDNFEAEVHEKESKVSEWLLSILTHHDLFSHLEDFELNVAIGAMSEVQRRREEVLFEEGDDGCDLFYVVYNGEVELSNQRDGILCTKKRGNTLNDLILMYPGDMRETAKCTENVVLYCLDRRTYRIVLSKASKRKRAMYEGFLNTVGFLKAASLSKFEVLQLADSLKPATYLPQESLIVYGEIGESFFIVVEGSVEVFGRDDQSKVIKVCEFTVGDCVGELEFINNHKCVADVKAKTFVRVAKMNRTHFEMVMGPVREVLARNASESTVYSYYRHRLEQMGQHA